jgi:YhcH/YjgK/YiaL family protein
MIFDQLKNWKTIPGFMGHPVWEDAFNWIEEHAASAEDGIHLLRSPGCFVRVMEYDLKERGEARYESHRRTIDLQFTIKGAEGIEVIPVDGLICEGDYLEEKDFQFYKLAERGAGRVDNFEGHFCVLFPQDGHMPQLWVPGHMHVRKLVVKIPLVAVS